MVLYRKRWIGTLPGGGTGKVGILRSEEGKIPASPVLSAQ